MIGAVISTSCWFDGDWEVDCRDDADVLVEAAGEDEADDAAEDDAGDVSEAEPIAFGRCCSRRTPSSAWTV